jgi:hypothetical protein
MTKLSPHPASLSRPITSMAEAEQLIAHVGDTLEALLRIVEEETALVRACKV